MIASKLDERSYKVETPDGDTYRRNRYHLWLTKENSDPKEAPDTTPNRSPEDQPTPAGPTQPASPACTAKSRAVTPKATTAPKKAAHKTTPSVSERLRID